MRIHKWTTYFSVFFSSSNARVLWVFFNAVFFSVFKLVRSFCVPFKKTSQVLVPVDCLLVEVYAKHRTVRQFMVRTRWKSHPLDQGQLFHRSPVPWTRGALFRYAGGTPPSIKRLVWKCVPPSPSHQVMAQPLQGSHRDDGGRL